VRRFCESIATASLRPLIEIRLPLHDFLNGHWAVTGRDVPRAGDSSAELEIPLRNLTLLSFALYRLKPAGDVALALGTTADNCYRDGSRPYFDKCEELFSFETGRDVEVLTPFIGLTKSEVIRRSDDATLALSFSCVNPRDDRHCGACIKCGRRQSAFQSAGVSDPTVYFNG
jgi:7-cyano-7-deazaguanine synthase